jgi:hypothetical protein
MASCSKRGCVFIFWDSFLWLKQQEEQKQEQEQEREMEGGESGERHGVYSNYY